MGFFDKNETRIVRALEALVSVAREIRDAIRELKPQPQLPTGFLVSETVQPARGESIMDAKGHAVGIQILPDGTVRFIFTPTPAGSTLPAGTPPLSYTSSDPALAVTVDPADTSGFGLVALGKPTLPAGSTGVTGIIVTGQTTLPGAAAPIVSDPASVDVVPAPNLPTGFSVQESAA